MRRSGPDGPVDAEALEHRTASLVVAAEHQLLAPDQAGAAAPSRIRVRDVVVAPPDEDRRLRGPAQRGALGRPRRRRRGATGGRSGRGGPSRRRPIAGRASHRSRPAPTSARSSPPDRPRAAGDEVHAGRRLAQGQRRVGAQLGAARPAADELDGERRRGPARRSRRLPGVELESDPVGDRAWPAGPRGARRTPTAVRRASGPSRGA